MADRRSAAAGLPHDRHDPELVARAAAGELAAAEAVAAGDLLAACRDCRALADDLRAIAAATRTLPSIRSGAHPRPAPRDFRLGAADAARLRRRRFRLGWGWAASAAGSRRLGGAMATLGLVGLLVVAGLPSIFAGAAGGAPAAGPVEELTRELDDIGTFGPMASDASALQATDGSLRVTGESPVPATGPAPTTNLLAVLSVGLLVVGLALILRTLRAQRPGP